MSILKPLTLRKSTGGGGEKAETGDDSVDGFLSFNLELLFFSTSFSYADCIHNSVETLIM